jgi:hypothetical protein
LAIFGIDGDQSSATFQGFVEENLENIFFATIFNRMLLPDERICSYGVKLMKILVPKGLQFEKRAFKTGWRSKDTRGRS